MGTMNEVVLKNICEVVEFENLAVPHFLQTWSEGKSWQVILGWADELMTVPELRRNYKIQRFADNKLHFLVKLVSNSKGPF